MGIFGGRFLTMFVALAALFVATEDQARAEKTITMSLERQLIKENEDVELKVTISGVQNAPEPNIVGIDAFEVAGQSSSTQMQIINGRFNASVVYSYQLFPKAIGEFTLGPAEITLAGNTVRAVPIKIRVVAAGQALPKDELYYITATISDKNPFVNEQIVYTFRFYNRARIANAQLNLPEFSGFWKEELGKQKEFQEIKDGVKWQVTEIKFALFPSSAGQIVLPPASLNLDVVTKRERGRGIFGDSLFGGFDRTKPQRLKSQEIIIETRALPPPPKNFTGLVGQFALTSKVSSLEPSAGDSITQTVVIAGFGNARDGELPSFAVPKMKIYADKPTFEMSVRQNRIYGIKTFKLALVPQAEGQQIIPPIAIKVFDPELESFQDLKSEAINLNVKPGQKQDLAHVSGSLGDPNKKSIQILGTDLMPMKSDVTGLSDGRIRETDYLSFAGVGLLMIFLNLATYFFKRYQERITKDSGYKKRSKAFNNFKRAITLLPDDQSFYDKSSTALRRYLGDRLGFDGGALTIVDTERKLKPFGISQPTIESLNTLLKQCEMGRFGGQGLTRETKGAMLKELGEISKNIEREA